MHTRLVLFKIDVMKLVASVIAWDVEEFVLNPYFESLMILWMFQKNIKLFENMLLTSGR